MSDNYVKTPEEIQADISYWRARTIAELVGMRGEGPFTPQSAVNAVLNNDFTLLEVKPEWK
jgi:hypothetical protein